MITLVLDTSTEFLFCALIPEHKQYIWSSSSAQKLHAELCVSTVEDLCNKLQVKPQDIREVIVSIGPGSFTGVRIALTVAKIFGYALNIPVFPLSTLAMYASAYADVLITIPARNKRLYAGHYQQNKLIGDEMVMDEQDLQTWKQQHPATVAISPQDVFFNPQLMIEAIIKIKHTLKPVGNIHHLKPFYFKEIA
jgi:tRNA threonylcarbamoyl adenosine modification protein YeaZ